MNESHQQSRAGKVLALLFANGVNLAIGILTMPYLARSLTYEEYGSYGQVLLVGTFFLVVFGLGSGQVINVLYAENEGSEYRVFSTNFWMFATSASVAAVTLAVASVPLASVMNNPPLRQLLPAYIPAVAFGTLATIYTTTLVYFGRVRQLAVATVLTNVIRIGLLVIAISIFKSLILAILALGIGSLIQAIWYLWLIPQKVRRFRWFDKRIARTQLSISFPLLIVSLFGTGAVNADGFIISGLLGVTEFAVYRAGAIEIPLIATVYGTVATVLMPDLARLAIDGKGKEIFELNRRASSVTAIAVLPITIFMIAFGEEFIRLYLSERYAASGIIFSIYSGAVLIRITMYQGIPLAYKKSRAILFCFLIAFGLNLLLNVALIPRLGAKGAAVAHVASQLFVAGYLTLLSRRLTGRPLAEFFDWRFLAMMAGLCAMAAASISYIHRLIPGYLVLGILACIYFVVVISFVRWVRPQHLEALTRILGRRFRGGRIAE